MSGPFYSKKTTNQTTKWEDTGDKGQVIYIDSTRRTTQMINDTNEAVGILQDSGIHTRQVRIIDTQGHGEISQWMLSKGKALEFPLVFIHKSFVGGIGRLRKEFEQKTLGALLEAPAVSSNDSHPKARYDQFIDAAEWMLRGVTFGMTGGFLYNQSTEKGESTAEESKMGDTEGVEPNDPNAVNFEVIRTNWYWRHQKRVLRFGLTKFCRVNPETNRIRATYNLKDLKSVTIANESYVILQFKDASLYPEHIDLGTPEAIKRMISLIEERATNIETSVVVEWK